MRNFSAINKANLKDKEIAMPISKGLLVSFGERKTFQILENYSTDFKVFPKVRFFDVIDWNTEGITSKEKKYLEKTHFDFVICGVTEPLVPLFAVEYDGIGLTGQDIDPYRSLKAETKIRICKKENFPVVWIGYEEIRSVDADSILNAILSNYLGSKWVDNMKARGEIREDDAYATIFPPTVKLLSKYNHLLTEISYEDNFGKLQKQMEDGFYEIKRKIVFRTDIGSGKIVRSAKVKTFDFQYFNSLCLADDLSLYECLKAFDQYVKEGKFIIKENVIHTYSFYK